MIAERRRPQGDGYRRSAAMFGEKFEDALLVRFAEAAFGDQAGHQVARSHVETEICGRAGLRRHANLDVRAGVKTIGVADFFGSAFLDRDLVYTVANIPIE